MEELYKPICFNPKKIKNLDQVLLVLEQLDDFEERNKCEGVVALSINRHIGGAYLILSKEYIEEAMKKPGKHEWYEKYYTRSFYEDLKHKFKNY